MTFCMICDREIDPHSTRLLYEITGYERARSQGGTNHVIAREQTGRVVGACCAEAVKRGHVGQGVLL